MNNPWAHEIYGCPPCRDIGWVTRGHSEMKCSSCEGWTNDHRREMKRSRMKHELPKPDLIQDNLTSEQRSRFRDLVLSNPDYAPITVLAWIEGQDYEPLKDPEFQDACRKALSKWHFENGIDEVSL